MTFSYTSQEIIRYTDAEGVERRIAGPTYSRSDLGQLKIADAIVVPASSAVALWEPLVWTTHPYQSFDLLEVWYENSLIAKVGLELTCKDGDAAEQIFLEFLKTGAKRRISSNESTFGIVAGGDGFARYATNPDKITRVRVKNMDLTNPVTVFMTMGRV